MRAGASILIALMMPLLLATCGRRSSASADSGSLPAAVPQGIPQLASTQARSAQAWHRDAYLVRIDVHNYFAIPGRPPDRSAYSLALCYYSPEAQATQVYVLGPHGQSYAHPAATIDTTRLPEKFVDLPDAISAASAIGLGSHLQSAILRWRSTPAEGNHLVWELNAPGGRAGRLVVMADTGQALRYGDLCQHCQSGEKVTNAEDAQARTAVSSAQRIAQNNLGPPDHISDGKIEPVSYESEGVFKQMVRCSNPADHSLGNPYTTGCHPAGQDIQGYVCWNVVRSQGRLIMLRGTTYYGLFCSIKPSDEVEYHVVNQNGGLQVYIDFPHAGGSHLLKSSWDILRYDPAACRAHQLISPTGNPCP
jgi:hypothetical protein